MDYLTGRQEHGPKYEFPYSGYIRHSTPFLNYNTDAIQSNNYSPPDNFLHHQQPNFNTSITSEMPSMLGNSTLVFQVPDYVSLDVILKQLGVDINSIRRSSSGYNYHNNPSSSLELSLPPRSSRHRSLICRESSDSESDNYQGYLSDNQRRISGRRRRLICHEVSDYESDNDQGRSSYRRRGRHGRHGPNSAGNGRKQRPPGIHNLLDNAWKQGRNPTKSVPQSNSTLNPQWQNMVETATPPQQPTGANNAFQGMLNNATPPQQPTGANNGFQGMLNNATLSQQPIGANNGFQGMLNNATPPQQSIGANNGFQGMLHNATPPQQPTGANNVWQAMQNPSNPISPQQGNPGVNNVWNKTNTAPDENTGFLARFRRKPSTTGTVFQAPPFQPNQAAMNNFLVASNPQVGVNQPNPALANRWSNVNNFQQQVPPLTSMPPPTMNTAWNMMSRG
ncbi:unnamed protein product [Rotaria magnacalcarata]|nr:unnamed protein product [Rotaria magnacalcarata]